MRNTLLLSAALAMLAAPVAFAQTGSTAGAPPSPAGPTPAETTAAPMTSTAKPMPRAMRHMNAPAATADIRPGHIPGVGESFPASDNASNILPSDTRSPIAPRLPAPAIGENATPAAFLNAAQNALNAHQTGKAQEALERAETAMLQRSVPADMASQPDNGPRVSQVQMARDALAKGDVMGAKKAIAAAMSAT
jgi:hypothetical protein